MVSDFIRVLRAHDIRISSAEALDAVAAADAVGLADRDLLKHALGQSLAKSADEKQAFELCFENYFRPPEDTPPENMADASPAETGDDLVAMLESGDAAGLQAAMAGAAAQSGVSDARLFTQQGMFMRAMAETMGLAELDAAINAARDAGDAERVEMLEARRGELFAQLRDYVDRQISMRTKNAGRLVREEALSRIRIGNLDRSDMHIMRGLIVKLAKRLAARHSRRRKTHRRGAPDIRRMLRRNVAHDGVLMELIRKRKRRDRPKLVVMCDVSGSVAAVARFFLMFLYSLGEIMPRTRSFVFSDRCGEVTDIFEREEIEAAMTAALRQFGGGTTDYGRSIADLAGDVESDIDHRTTLLILGDARANYADPGHAKLRGLARRAARVIWLNPEVESLWDTGDSEMQRLGACCTHVRRCNSVRDIERVVDTLLRGAV